MKKILITGKNSYIGTSLEKWLAKEPENYQVDTVDTRDGIWKEKDFSPYDTVFHVAGIAHVSTDPKMEDLYYKVNRDLTVDIAKKAKAEDVKQFIFMSSIIVYGDSTSSKRVIKRDTVPTPSNFYGYSKLQAEKGLEPLEDENFKIAIIRPPMIYGKGSKGNYPRLSKLAQKTPIFADFENQRSMLYIENLNEFLKLVIANEDRGLFFPQNKEYISTSEMVFCISQIHGKKIILTPLFNPIIKMLFSLSVVNKVFGNLVYEKEMSIYDNKEYRIIDFKTSIKMTEMESKQT